MKTLISLILSILLCSAAYSQHTTMYLDSCLQSERLSNNLYMNFILWDVEVRNFNKLQHHTPTTQEIKLLQNLKLQNAKYLYDLACKCEVIISNVNNVFPATILAEIKSWRKESLDMLAELRKQNLLN